VTAPSSSEIRERLVRALELDLVGPWHGHHLAEERIPGWIRPSNWYLTGFLIPSGTPPEKAADDDEDDDFELVAESAGLAEESNDDRKAAKKGFFPSSMGLSFLVPKEAPSIDVVVRWGDYVEAELPGSDGKPASAWQRRPREEALLLPLTASSEPTVRDIPQSGGLQLHLVVQPITASENEAHIPRGTRSVSVFLVNRRPPVAAEQGKADLAYAFQPGIEVVCRPAFVPRPDLRGAHAAEWDEQVADLHYADTPE
jgi:hypothetical protein